MSKYKDKLKYKYEQFKQEMKNKKQEKKLLRNIKKSEFKRAAKAQKIRTIRKQARASVRPAPPRSSHSKESFMFHSLGTSAIHGEGIGGDLFNAPRPRRRRKRKR